MPIPLRTPPSMETASMYASYEEFFQAYWHRVVRYLHNKCSSYADAEDIASQAFLYCHQNWHQYDARKASQSTWLFMIVRSRWLNYCRSQKKHVDMDMLSNVLFDENDPLHQAIELESMRQQIASALETLPVNQKKAVIFRFFGDKSNEEIAQILDTSPGNVRVMIFRALKKLKESMRHPENEEYR